MKISALAVPPVNVERVEKIFGNIFEELNNALCLSTKKTCAPTTNSQCANCLYYKAHKQTLYATARKYWLKDSASHGGE